MIFKTVSGERENLISGICFPGSANESLTCDQGGALLSLDLAQSWKRNSPISLRMIS